MTRKPSNPYPLCNPKILRTAGKPDLEKTQLFKDVDEFWLNHVAKNSSLCRLAAKKSLNCVRGGVDHLYLIVKGYVAIWRPPCLGAKDYTFLAWRGPGQPIGEMRVLGEPRLTTRIDTCEPCEFIEIREDAFSDVLKALHQIGALIIYRNITTLLLKKMRYQGHRSEVIQMKSATGKIAQTLLHLAEERLEPDDLLRAEIVIPGAIRQEQIAAYAGSITPHTVGNELGKLENRRIISKLGTKRGTEITILNRERLVSIAEDDRPWEAAVKKDRT